MLMIVGGWVGLRLVVLAVAHGGMMIVPPVGVPGARWPGGPTAPAFGGVAMLPLDDAWGHDLGLQSMVVAPAPAPVAPTARPTARTVDPAPTVMTAGGAQLPQWLRSPGLRLQALQLSRLLKSGENRGIVAMLGRAASASDAGLTYSAAPALAATGVRIVSASVIDRWSLDLIAFFRGGAVVPGAAVSSGAGGTAGQGAAGLGGTQHAAILRYRIDASGHAETFVRLTSVGDPPHGETLAVGVAVQPLRTVPLRVVAEHRQRIGHAGRSSGAIYVAGGGSVQAGRWQVDSYGAAGIVGMRRRDGFVEGVARATTPVLRVGNFDLAAGGGGWAGAQRGVARVDAGPTMLLRPRGVAAPTVALDWRERVAGDATPAHSAALTVSMRF
jgi:hypothetical protein